MFLLRWLDLVLSWPEIFPAHAIGGCCAILIPVFLVGACNAVVLHAGWVMAVGPTLVAHVAGVPVVGHLDMYRTKVLLYRTMVLMARLTKVRR